MATTLDRKLAVVRLEDCQGQGNILCTAGSYATGWPLAGLLVRPVLEILELVRGALRQRDFVAQCQS